MKGSLPNKRRKATLKLASIEQEQQATYRWLMPKMYFV